MKAAEEERVKAEEEARKNKEKERGIQGMDAYTRENTEEVDLKKKGHSHRIKNSKKIGPLVDEEGSGIHEWHDGTIGRCLEGVRPYLGESDIDIREHDDIIFQLKEKRREKKRDAEELELGWASTTEGEEQESDSPPTLCESTHEVEGMEQILKSISEETVSEEEEEAPARLLDVGRIKRATEKKQREQKMYENIGRAQRKEGLRR